MKEATKVRVRFAPSPTGPFNLGNARTALINWLFAKGKNGALILRIEDTDRERSRKKYEDGILEALRWLELDWDEFYRQSERTDLYTGYLLRLLKEGIAYHCFCSPEELEAERNEQFASGLPPKYSGKCRSIPLAEAREMAARGKSVVRFRMPEKKIAFHDLIRGRVVVDTSLIGDIVIAKSESEPLYNFAAAVDDYELRITHVIRGEDHISNTPKQIALAEAMGFASPREFIHLPLILGADRKKLSKRHLAKSVLEYREEGYLPQAMRNFLVLLGWHPKEDREVLSFSEMVSEFSFDRVQKSGAVLNPDKLDWFNTHYLKELGEEELVQFVRPHLPEAWFSDASRIRKVLGIERERMRRLTELKDDISFFFELPDYDSTLLLWKGMSKERAAKNLRAEAAVIQNISDDSFSAKVFEREIAALAEREGRGEMFWPLRVALTGREHSPGPFECAEALGKGESLRRIEAAVKKLS